MNFELFYYIDTLLHYFIKSIWTFGNVFYIWTFGIDFNFFLLNWFKKKKFNRFYYQTSIILTLYLWSWTKNPAVLNR